MYVYAYERMHMCACKMYICVYDMCINALGLADGGLVGGGGESKL